MFCWLWSVVLDVVLFVVADELDESAEFVLLDVLEFDELEEFDVVDFDALLAELLVAGRELEVPGSQFSPFEPSHPFVHVRNARAHRAATRMAMMYGLRRANTVRFPRCAPPCCPA